MNSYHYPAEARGASATSSCVSFLLILICTLLLAACGGGGSGGESASSNSGTPDGGDSGGGSGTSGGSPSSGDPDGGASGGDNSGGSSAVGELDTTFGIDDDASGFPDGWNMLAIDGEDVYMNDVAVDSQGRIVAVGTVWGSGALVVRFLSDGTFDTTFGEDYDLDTVSDGYVIIPDLGGGPQAKAVKIDASDSIIVTGHANTASDPVNFLFRMTSAGEMDSTFGGGDGYLNFGFVDALNNANALAIDSANRFVVVGTSDDNVHANEDLVIWRILANGSGLDTAFGGGDGFVKDTAGSTDDQEFISDLQIDASGRYMIAGQANYEAVLWRYNSDGTIDDSFGGDGVVQIGDVGASGLSGFHGLALDDSGNVIATGWIRPPEKPGDPDMLLARFDANGAADTNFGEDNDSSGTPDGYLLRHSSANPSNGGLDDGNDVLIDGSGKIVITGQSYDPDYLGDVMLIWRFQSNGTADTSFGDDLDTNGVPDGVLVRGFTSGGINEVGNAMISDSESRLVIVGSNQTNLGEQRGFIWRYN